MKPPYTITSKILRQIASITEKIGEVNAYLLTKPSPQLRKQSKIRTIYSSLRIEGNSLTLDQVSALVDNKRVVGPVKDILEVTNAIQVYENIESFNFKSETSFLNAHCMLMDGLVEDSGRYRNQNVGVFQGSKISHIAPPSQNVGQLMGNLFHYLHDEDELSLISSCVFHYELEFIHPFLDGNGRMGRLWQTVILMNEYPVFEFLPFESLISQTQQEYYAALKSSDQQGQSTPFIEYMLNVIDKSLAELLSFNNRILTDIDRLNYFIDIVNCEFSRKDYMNVFKDISMATASRDLKKGVDLNLFQKSGDKNKTVYKVVAKSRLD
jgi:Fic family protein